MKNHYFDIWRYTITVTNNTVYSLFEYAKKKPSILLEVWKKCYVAAFIKKKQHHHLLNQQDQLNQVYIVRITLLVRSLKSHLSLIYFVLEFPNQFHHHKDIFQFKTSLSCYLGFFLLPFYYLSSICVFFLRSLCFFFYQILPKKKEKHWFFLYIQSTSYKNVHISPFLSFSKNKYG